MSRRFNVAALAVFASVAALACGASEPAVARSASFPEPAATVAVAPAPDPQAGSSVGDRAPGFEMQLADGTLVTFASLIAESRPAFLFFFATW